MNSYFFPTIDVESWVCSDFFSTNINNVEATVSIIKPLSTILDIFQKYNANSTFFILGETAEKCPEIVEMIYDKGHEVASHNFTHESMIKLTKSQFLNDAKKTKNILEKIINSKIHGFRSPNAKVNKNICDLSKVGYTYDSSIVNSIKIPGWYGGISNEKLPFLLSTNDFNVHQKKEKNILEVPISSHPNLRLPFGGWWLRNLGHKYGEKALEISLKKYKYANVYFHPWEFTKIDYKLPWNKFHVFRNTGNYVKKSFENMIKTSLRMAKIVPIQYYLESH